MVRTARQAYLGVCVALLGGGLPHPSIADEGADGVPFPGALRAAAIVQTPMAAGIPGSMVLGNGDLNGILWVTKGRLRFSITKNDACDGRLVTADDPDLCTIDVRNGTWNADPGSSFPPSWATPYPTPLVCAHVDLSDAPAEQPMSTWVAVRREGASSLEYRGAEDVVVGTIEGRAGESAGWGFVPTVTDPAKRVTARLSGSANAKWYLDFPGTDVHSGWQPAAPEAAQVTFDIPAETKLSRFDLYIWTDDGRSAEIRLHSVTVNDVPQPLAKIELPERATPFRSELDPARAAATVTQLDGEHGTALRTIEARVLAGRNVALFRTDGPIALAPTGNRHYPAGTRAGWSLPADESDIDAPRFVPEPESGKRGHAQWLLTTVPGDLDWAGMAFAVAMVSQGDCHAVSVVTSYEASDPVAAAVELANETLAEDRQRTIAAHEAAWARFWSASGVSLDDPYLASVWYRNLYFLRCFSRPGVQPVGLFLGCATEVMPWHGVATTDYNFEQCFWPAFATNHPELAEPYNRFMVDYLARGQWFSKVTYGFDGAFYPVNHFTHQNNDPANSRSRNRHMNFYFPFSYVPGANGWQAQNVWLAYLYRPDPGFLETDAYPIVREMAIYYANFLERCALAPDGRAVYGPSYSPEHRDYGVSNTPCDIAFTRFTLKAAIQGAETLGRDAALVERWRAALALVPDYPRAPGSDPPVVSDVEGGEPITYNVAVPALPVFPSGDVNWWSPEGQKKLFADTIETMSWTGYNSTMILAGARARLSMPGTYEWITSQFQERQMPNGFLMMLGGGYGRDTSGNFSEQVAAAGIVSEMLLQSVGGIVRVFPAWPAERDARFERLLAEGGYEVSASKRGGAVESIRVRAGFPGHFRFLSPWPAARAAVAGEPVLLRAEGNGVFALPLDAGDIADIVPGRAPNA